MRKSATASTTDMVNKPPHYQTPSGLQPIEVVEAFDLVGTAMEGGYLAGYTIEDGQRYAVIVAPKAEGEHSGLKWNDAIAWCAALNLGSHGDWRLPTRDELELCYRNLKPTSARNYVYSRGGDGNGHNALSDPPGAPYTADNPTQTSVASFQKGGAEAFETAWYWSSTEFGSAGAWIQVFVVGYQDTGVKNLALRVRAVRKVLI